MAVRLLAEDALILVDVQLDFLPGGSLAVPHGDEVVPALNRYIRSIPLADPTGGAEVMKLELRESDMRGVIRGIINKLK